jgi:hypothetical protein
MFDDQNEVPKPFDADELKGCWDCLHYDCEKPHLRTEGEPVRISCRRNKGNGLTPVAEVMEECEHFKKDAFPQFC